MKINWLRIHSIIYDRKQPFMLNIKEYCANETATISVSLSKEKKKKKRKTSEQFPKISLKHLYNARRKISDKKYKDLIHLSKYIPQKFHGFYKSLKFSTKINDSEDDSS